ncbi:MAG: 3'-5' exonuclease [Betaproteobacteria bacterium]|nr:3'-5' exonuclease [Betaproteobacteria bacterium]
MIPVLVFDIETVPDVAALRRLRDFDPAMSDHDVADAAFQARKEATGSEFLPHYLHRIVAISCALRDRETFRVWSLGDPEEPEGALIQRFFDGIERLRPQLVSWNGGGFDLPVLHYRGLRHGVHAAKYWDLGEDDRDFKWNNYISRYHTRHLDLMDLLAMYQPRANAPLDEFSQMLGLPGKVGMAGARVWSEFQAGNIGGIRSYCETDVVNTYLVYLRFQLMRGMLTIDSHRAECDLVAQVLERLPGEHWRQFLGGWERT